jgi:hypothetical protein
MTHQQQALPLPAPATCDTCGHYFTPRDNNSEFCSEECAEVFWGYESPGTPNSTQPDTPGAPTARVRDCLQCGQVFTPQDPHTELCSHACAVAWWGLEYIDFLEDNQRSIAA